MDCNESGQLYFNSISIMQCITLHILQLQAMARDLMKLFDNFVLTPNK